MKPLQVVLSAFGSYGGVEIVDFERLKRGLFLITGDTGAGKSTIFDAVAFALYGESSGGKREGSMMRSHYAPEGQETYVTLRFQADGKIYEVYRSPGFSRTSRRKGKDGTYSNVFVPAKVRLTMPDGTELPGNSRDINEKLVEIIGVDQTQFSQIAMIAQGAYIQLLYASSRERKEIFSKIFQTNIYLKIQQKLKEKNQELQEQLEDNRKLFQHEIERISLPSESVLREMWSELLLFPETKTHEICEMIAVVIGEIRKEKENIIWIFDENQKQLSQLRYKIQQSEEVNALFLQKDQAEQCYKDLEEERADWNLRKEGLLLAKKAGSAEIFENQFLDQQTQLEKTKQKIYSLMKELEIQAQESESAVRQWEKSRQCLLEESPELSRAITRLQDVMPIYLELQERRKVYEEEKEKAGQIQKRTAAVTGAIAALIRQIDDWKQEMEGLENSRSQELNYRKRLEWFQQRKQELGRVKLEEGRLQQYQKEKETSQSDTLQAQKIYEENGRRYEDQNRRFIAVQSGILAQKLLEDNPCPVCGSCVHPRKAVLPEQSVTEAQVEEHRRLRDLADRKLRQASERSGRAVELFSDQKAVLREVCRSLFTEGYSPEPDKENLNEAVKELYDQQNHDQQDFTRTRTEIEAEEEQCERELLSVSEQLKHASASLERYEQCVKLLADAGGKHDKLDLERIMFEKMLQEQERILLRLQTEAEQIEKKLPYSSKAEAEAMDTKLSSRKMQIELEESDAKASLDAMIRSEKERRGRLGAELDKQTELEDSVLEASSRFTHAWNEQGFTNLGEYQNAKKSPKIIAELELDCQSFSERFLQAETIYLKYQELTAGRERVEAAAWKSQAELLEDKKKNLQAQMGEITGICSRNESAEQTIRALLQLRSGLQENYQVIHDLYQAANGKLNKAAGLDFQTYVQRQFFNQMIQEANKRLLFMTDGQFLLQCRELQDLGKQGEVGLDLDVYSMVNDQTRDVKTLSGGESFMAALSMALGMGDVIQNMSGSIQVDTMFVDEGFGSLDEEARTRAIQILQQLTGERCLIGIISHVAELKEQIDQKLVVKKSEKGSNIRWELDE